MRLMENLDEFMHSVSLAIDLLFEGWSGVSGACVVLGMGNAENGRGGWVNSQGTFMQMTLRIHVHNDEAFDDLNKLSNAPLVAPDGTMFRIGRFQITHNFSLPVLNCSAGLTHVEKSSRIYEISSNHIAGKDCVDQCELCMCLAAFDGLYGRYTQQTTQVLKDGTTIIDESVPAFSFRDVPKILRCAPVEPELSWSGFSTAPRLYGAFQNPMIPRPVVCTGINFTIGGHDMALLPQPATTPVASVAGLSVQRSRRNRRPGRMTATLKFNEDTTNIVSAVFRTLASEEEE